MFSQSPWRQMFGFKSHSFTSAWVGLRHEQPSPPRWDMQGLVQYRIFLSPTHVLMSMDAMKPS